jgi:hypothetical protein
MLVMDELNPPMIPEVLDPKPFAALAGDHSDDDGQALDDYFMPNPGGPVSYDTLLNDEGPTLPATTRLLSRSLRLQPNADGSQSDAVQLLPADPNRTTCLIYVTVTTAGELRFGSDKTDCLFGPSLLTGVTFDISGHTGAVWAVHLGLTGTSDVRLVTVTK